MIDNMYIHSAVLSQNVIVAINCFNVCTSLIVLMAQNQARSKVTLLSLSSDLDYVNGHMPGSINHSEKIYEK